MKLIGLTGNIGCGKSTVASLISEYGDVAVLNCDDIAKKVITEQKMSEVMSSILGMDVLADGSANFGAIAGVIFKDDKKKKALEAIVHPVVWQEIERLKDQWNDKNILIVESAIIYETQWEERFSGIVVATCNQIEQFHRLMKYRKMSLDEIQFRLNYQFSQSEKVLRADWVIDTTGTKTELAEKVKQLYDGISRQLFSIPNTIQGKDFRENSKYRVIWNIF